MAPKPNSTDWVTPKVPTWGFLPLPTGHCLTQREHELLRLLVQGLSTRQIAEQMLINTITVKFHMRSVFAKLGTKSRAETVEYTLSKHLLPEG